MEARGFPEYSVVEENTLPTQKVSMQALCRFVLTLSVYGRCWRSGNRARCDRLFQPAHGHSHTTPSHWVYRKFSTSFHLILMAVLSTKYAAASQSKATSSSMRSHYSASDKKYVNPSMACSLPLYLIPRVSSHRNGRRRQRWRCSALHAPSSTRA